MTLWMRITSIASVRLSAGRIDGKRWASIVLPVPGGPLSRLLWAPAAAITRACTASGCPRTSLRSGLFRAVQVGARLGWGSGSGAPPLSTRAALESRSTTPTVSPSTSVASPAREGASTSISRPAFLVASATASVPWQARTSPSSESSPKSACVSSRSPGICPLAASTPQASARSKPGPIFGTSAGARFAVMRRAGNS
jgi:hypothetical protein